ncbi:hypothetical protein B7494_g2312 [Chlorociboria aeruginascens]|nr:hypothetical protein B7494_g2312 [Chlorociboria aeruginascens]
MPLIRYNLARQAHSSIQSTRSSSHSTTRRISTGTLKGKNTIITGGSRGIGAEIAKRFANEGAKCVLIGRDSERLNEVVNGLSGEGHQIRVGDVGDNNFWKEWRRDDGATDILVNAAGLTHYSPLVVTDPGFLESILRTNLNGTIWACRSVGRGMMRNKGVDRLTRALAGEIGPLGVRVNVILPGYIETDMTVAMTPKAREEARTAIPLKRFGNSSDIADAAMFLATNKYANNCVLNIDGGLSAV